MEGDAKYYFRIILAFNTSCCVELTSKVKVYRPSSKPSLLKITLFLDRFSVQLSNVDN